ncbi:M15 family metallopeptidase [Kribbella sp. NPDC051770]|uniref:M15 family metallopeptidase n=1 Tax=Kribbella sp. NPDC051770 TaxID=3155413 RepID=UPI003430A2E4
MLDVVLMADPAVTGIPVADNGEPLVDLAHYSDLRLADGAHHHVRKGVADRLVEAERLLPGGLHLLVVDAHRPPHVCGAAVDLTLCSPAGAEISLGTEVNAAPGEACFMAATGIPAPARRYRRVLSNVMSSAGFVNYPTEWWHWSYGDQYWALSAGQPAALYAPVDR